MKSIIKNQKLFFISLIGIVIVSGILLTTFAYQTLQVEYKSGSKEKLTVTSGVLDVTFNVTNRINMTNMPLVTSYKSGSYSEFTINNSKSDADASYRIKLVDMEYSSNLVSTDFNYTLYSVTNSEIIDEGNFSLLSNTEMELSSFRTILKSKTETVRLYLWLKETTSNQNNLENSSFKGKIQIESMFDSDAPKRLNDTIISSAQNAKENNDSTRTIYQEIPSTKPAEEISGETEKTLSTAPDDYGTSYYFRGNVIDNYVDFAGMCWRVVRVSGNGTIKLILEDQDSTCATSDGNWNIPTETGGTAKTGNFGYIQYAANTLTATDGTKNSDTKYIMDYLNGNSTSMVTAFKNFQTGPLAKYLIYLNVENWCIDDNAYTSNSDFSKTLTNIEILNKQVKGEEYLYNSYVRLYKKTTKESTLKCVGTIINKFKDNENMYVGTLTADEIVYTGAKFMTINSNYYLYNNYQKSNSLIWIPLTPAYFSDTRVRVFRANNDGRLIEGYVNSSNFSFRPAVSLNSSTTITGGDGTKANAYTIG